jgi:choline dehydrogenase-like flavoprotein
MADANGLPLLREDFGVPRVDVQSTTFSVDALGRFICNSWGEATGSGPFDVIVVGSGMYGGYCAEKVFRRGKRVLVLEAGPFLVSEHVQNLARIGLNVPQPVLPESAQAAQARELVWGIAWRGNQIFPGQAYCVGGKSLYWGGWSPRLTGDVLASWPAAARAYLQAKYERLELQLGVTERRPGQAAPQVGTDFIDDTDPNGLQRRLFDRIAGTVGAVLPHTLEAPRRAPVAVQGQAPSSGLFSFDKYSSGPLLIDALREDAGRAGLNDFARRLFLVPKCRVLRLDAEGGAVRRLQVFVDGAQKTLDLAPNAKVVLAGGCIESTRLALESFPTPLMGRNLMVHLRSNFAFRLPRARLGLAPGPVQTAAMHVPGVSAKGGRYHIQVVAGANRDGGAEAVWFRTVPDQDILEQILANEDSDFVAVQFRSCAEMLGIKGEGTPNGALSWIDLSPFERDEFGFRRAYVHLATLPPDDELWAEMDEVALQLAERLGQGDTEFLTSNGWSKQRPSAGLLTTEGNPRGIRDALGTTYHESGTLWMGDDPAGSVTDPTGRFHHLSNAWCCDQSLFPRIGSANPVLTGLTLARQVAETVA